SCPGPDGRALLHALLYPLGRKPPILLAAAFIEPPPSARRDGQAPLAAQQPLPASRRRGLSRTRVRPISGSSAEPAELYVRRRRAAALGSGCPSAVAANDPRGEH